MFGQFTDSESRVFDLPDGRVLFYAAGRAYYQTDYSQAQRLETRLKWAHNLLTLAVVGTILTAYWSGNWWLALGTLPLVILMGFAERFAVFGCTEATDAAARAHVNARDLARELNVGSTLIWPVLAALGPLMPAILRGKVTRSPFQVLELVLVVGVVALGVVQLLRQRRARREGEIIGAPRSIDNTPIVPR
jgi:hypothetical protein